MTHLHMGEGRARPHVPELLINWHLTETCKFNCCYCYAKWNEPDDGLIHYSGRIQKPLWDKRYEINATFDGITAFTAELAAPFDRTGKEWRWRVRSTAHVSRGQDFFELQVHVDVLFLRIGRRLWSQCVVLSLQRNSKLEKYVPANEVVDYSCVSHSGL